MTETLIYESRNSQIYLLDTSEWGVPTVRKTLNNEYPSPTEIAAFYNEFDIISGLQAPGIRKVLKRDRYNRKHAIYLEYVDSKTLSEGFAGKQNDIVDFLHLAIAIARALSEIHKCNIIHKDISPTNILINLQNRSATIIDFGLSSKLDIKNPYLGNPQRLEGHLAYMSPEQTGRMNRTVDYRSDLYSMGAVFYEMLAGRPLFTAKDAMALVHAHLAQTPDPLHEVNQKVPGAISNIVARLLAKNAEDRYQTAEGVIHDLSHCLAEFEQNAKIEPFDLGSNDHSGKFQIPQKLYGRATETATLMQAFESAAAGALNMVLVAGYSGTGKSALVSELHKPITEKCGHFIEGKFDQFQRVVPYFAILQAFQSYIDLLLTEREEYLLELREVIQKAVGKEGRVVTSVLPNLELIIGEQPAVPDIGGAETQHRFNYVFSRFVEAISSKEHPISLFIDDLQWADAASLNLLKVLMTDSNNSYLLCIGAYRDNEVGESHPLMIALAEMRESGAEINTIKVENLLAEDVNALLSESLASPLPEIAPLGQLVYAKTQGNAFFVTQFLKSLYQDGQLYFDKDETRWRWDLKEIEQLDITDNVVELMAKKIQKLPQQTQQLLKLAACVGNRFDLDTLAVIDEKEVQVVRDGLQDGLSEGLLVPLGEQYRFAHDRIQQAVYSLIPEADRSSVHLSIGKLLLETLGPEQQEERLFDIVNQWNQGIESIQAKKQKEMLAELNLRAARKAKQASAFKPAFAYLQTGIELLPSKAWQSHYALSRDLYTEAAETAYLNGDFELMGQHIDMVLENAEDLLEKVVPYEIRILAYKAENRLLDAIYTGLDVLGQLGEKFPKNATMAHVMVDLLKTKARLSGKDITTLSALPDMEDTQKIAAMRIIADIASCSYWATPALFPLLIFRMCRLSLTYGNTSLSAFGFATYGVIMCGVLGAMKPGYEYGKLGLILLDRFNAREWLTQIYTPIYALINIWNEHVENTLSPLQESYHIGLETGAIEFACINANIYCIAAYLTGRPLDKIESETRAYSESFDHYKQETNFNYNEVYRQGMLNFMGRSEDPLVLTGDAYNEEKMIAQNRERNDQTGAFFIHFNKLILCYYFQDYKQAYQHAIEARKRLESVLAKFEIPNHHFYEALTLLAMYPGAKEADKRKMMKRVRGNLRKLKKWSKDAKVNYLHKYQLVNAERLRVLGRQDQARMEYDRAIAGATANRYIHEEGLAYEIAGRFYLHQQSEGLAEFHLKAAYNAYREWGAQAKLRNLEQRYPQYISSSSTGHGSIVERSSIQGTSTTMTDRSMLDLSTVLKASTAISGQIVLQDLLTTLMKIVVENAGAQHGYLILEKDGKLLIEAKFNVDLNKIEVLQAEPLQEGQQMASSIVKYVNRTRESVVVNDAQNDERYSQDAYIKTQAPQSIMCVPVINQGKFVGILYLENNLATGAFTQTRIELLSLLSGQIAVSIDNAMLYENLELKVQERTEELDREKQKSDELLLNILPLETADELKTSGKAVPRSYENVSVMFTDFKNFTNFSEKMSAEELVHEIDTCFGAFDEIIAEFGLEKIKTIGDAYMCAGGLPIPNSTHAVDTVKAALAIRDWVEENQAERKAKSLPTIEIRVGIHSGPVVAGVVGTRKFAYDIWGETVNTASRMESSGKEGNVNISGATFAQLGGRFDCEYRGRLPAKNMQDIDMYFVKEKTAS
jgi:predicted ATPase/class 3 adenylate cyclase